MSLKQASLPALVALLITGSAGIANAESNIHGSSSGTTAAFTSGAMEDDYTLRQAPGFRRTQGTLPDEGGPRGAGPFAYSYGPYGYGAYGYAPSHRQVHSTGKMKRTKTHR